MLTVRLVDRRTGNAKGHALLTWAEAGRAATPAFEATVPLCGLDVADVRADVFDALSDVPPAPRDEDQTLQEVRRAVVFIAEWRHLSCLSHLPHVPAEPVQTLRDLAKRLQPHDAAAADPIFAGGPSVADLEALADLGARRLFDKLRQPRGTGLLARTGGAASLLVAELAACAQFDPVL